MLLLLNQKYPHEPKDWESAGKFHGRTVLPHDVISHISTLIANKHISSFKELQEYDQNSVISCALNDFENCEPACLLAEILPPLLMDYDESRLNAQELIDTLFLEVKKKLSPFLDRLFEKKVHDLICSGLLPEKKNVDSIDFEKGFL